MSCEYCNRDNPKPLIDDGYTMSQIEFSDAFYGTSLLVVTEDDEWYTRNVPIKCCPMCGERLDGNG